MKTANTAQIIGKNGWSMLLRVPLAATAEISWEAHPSSGANSLLFFIQTEVWREALAFPDERE